MIWVCKAYRELTTDELYALIKLRQRVFVVEQNCPYLDLDDKDQRARHLWHAPPGGELAAYLRYFGPGELYAEASLGRVVTAPERRRDGLGRALLREGLARVEADFGRCPVRIGAQAYLERFYASFGFARSGPDYVEDGIPHLTMTRPG
jgi:ElaA protein